MFRLWGILAALALAGCAPSVPDSGAGVGFQDYGEYQRDRAAQLQGQGGAVAGAGQPGTARQEPGAPLSAISHLDDPPPPAGLSADPDAEPTAEALARAARDAIGAGSSQEGEQSDLPRWSPEAPSQDGGGDDRAPGSSDAISDQSFDADAAGTNGAETEAERQARMSAEYEMIDPGALPERDGDAPNIVAYALRTTNRVGEQVYRRSPIQFRNHERACAEFASQDLAQEEFLRRGGPERDPLNLDPDGDGFACWWDPEPYRAAARAAGQE